jgi:small subunit ribosomal protein S20
MPNHKSAEKRDRQAERRAEVNRRNRSSMRTELKKLRVAIASGKKDDAVKLLPAIISVIDRSVQKGVLHQNAAARHKSRLTMKVNALGQAAKTA